MGLSPDEWRRALALSGAGADTIGMFDGLNESDVQRLRAEDELRKREETQRALDQLGGGNRIPQMEVGPVELRGQGPSMDVGPVEITRQTPALRDELPENPYPPEVQQALAVERGEQQPLPPRNQEIDAAYQARTLPKMDPDWEIGQANRGAGRTLKGAPAETGELGVTGPAPRFDTRAPALPPGTNGALERSGSQYRVPEPEPENDAQRLMLDDVAFARAKGDSAADSLQRQAEIRGQQGEAVRESMAETRKSVEERRAQQQKFEAMAMERLDRITALADNPPQEVRDKARIIMGGLLSFASGGRVSDGRKEMGEALANDVARWKAEIEANKALLGAELDMSKHAGGEAERDARLDAALLETGFGYYNAEFEREKLTAQSHEARRAAEEAQRTLVQGYVRGRMYTMPLDELAQSIANGEVGEEGQKIYAERAKASQEIREGELDIESKRASIGKTRAETEKLGREAAEGSAPVIPGWEATAKLSPATVTEIQKNQAMTADLIADLGRLRAIRTKNGDWGTVDRDDGAIAQGIIGRMSTKLSQMNGAGAPSEGERELFMKSLTDPTGFYMFKHPNELYDRMSRDFQSGFDAKAESLGMRKVGSQPAGGGGGLSADDLALGARPRGGSRVSSGR